MGIEEYTKRLGAYAKIDIVEVADEKAPEKLSDSGYGNCEEKRRGTYFSKN